MAVSMAGSSRAVGCRAREREQHAGAVARVKGRADRDGESGRVVRQILLADAHGLAGRFGPLIIHDHAEGHCLVVSLMVAVARPWVADTVAEPSVALALTSSTLMVSPGSMAVSLVAVAVKSQRVQPAPVKVRMLAPAS